jgi:xylulokinase
MNVLSAPLFLGIDLGTSRLKLQVIDSQAEPLAEASVPIQMSIPQPGWAEQHPSDWWGALVAACGDLFAEGKVAPARIAAVGLTGQMHGAVFLGAGGDVLRPSLIWADGRTAEQVDQIKRILPLAGLIGITGNAPNTSFTATKIMWVRQHEPEVYVRTSQVLLPKDYLRYRLTGEHATDVSDASATLLFDLARRSWSPDLLNAFDIRPAMLPAVHESRMVTGYITAEASRATGIPAGVPVVAGGGDAECGALGLGLTGSPEQRGVLLSNLGTSGQIFATTDAPRVDPRGRVHSLCHVVEHRWHVMGAILSGGVALSWARNLLTPAEQGSVEEALEYDTLTTEAAQAGIGAGGVLFLPYLLGERTPHMDPDASAVFYGLRLHHNRAHMVRAVLEGVALALRDGLEVLREMGISLSEVRLVGGGARSALWREIQRDVFNLPVRAGVAEHGAAYGAALLAAVGVQAFENVDEALAGKSWGELSQPDPEAAAEYEKIYARYRQLYPALRGI